MQCLTLVLSLVAVAYSASAPETLRRPVAMSRPLSATSAAHNLRRQLVDAGVAVGSVISNTQNARCDTLFNPGCANCTESACTAVEAGFFIHADDSGKMVSERCNLAFGSECTECLATECTRTLPGWFPLLNSTTGVVAPARYVINIQPLFRSVLYAVTVPRMYSVYRTARV